MEIMRCKVSINGLYQENIEEALNTDKSTYPLFLIRAWVFNKQIKYFDSNGIWAKAHI